MTYDYLDMLELSHLELTLPFPESQNIGYQFRCMTGAHESYVKELEEGRWPGFSSSLDSFDMVTPELIKRQMRLSDEAAAQAVQAAGPDDGERVGGLLLTMIEHEVHHQGQLINLMFCHHLPVPASWRDKWALAYED